MKNGALRRAQCLAVCVWMLAGGSSAVALGEGVQAPVPKPASVAAHHKEPEERHAPHHAEPEKKGPVKEERNLESVVPDAEKRAEPALSPKERISRAVLGPEAGKDEALPAKPDDTDSIKRPETPDEIGKAARPKEPENAPKDERAEKPGLPGKGVQPAEPGAPDEKADPEKPGEPVKKQEPALSPKEKSMAALDGPQSDSKTQEERPKAEPAVGMKEKILRAVEAMPEGER